MERFLDAGFQVLLETSGSLDIGGVDPRVVKIIDLKAPGSGEVKRMIGAIFLSFYHTMRSSLFSEPRRL